MATSDNPAPEERALTPERPFPGPDPYRKHDEPYFKGRDDEADELERIVLRSTLTVLFGASGLGKSSLILAGLFPRLERRGTYFPIRVRLKLPDNRGGPTPSLADQVTEGLRRAAVAQARDHDHAEKTPTLWEYFHQVEVWGKTFSLLTPVVVLDQFEEVFTLGQENKAATEAVDAFRVQLGDLVENRVPEEILRAVAGDDRVRWLDRPSEVRVVLSLREEYLPHLEGWRRELPSVMQNRIRLTPMRGDRAEKAIVDSAGTLLSHPVATRIVQIVAASTHATKSTAPREAGQGKGAGLSLDELSVEPSLLNLFCYQLNERRLGAEKPATSIDDPLVDSAGDRILDDFIESCIGGMSTDVREFVEQGLIVSGYRLSIPVEVAKSEWDVSETDIDTLVTRRLLRRDTRARISYVEIVHDVLADAIDKARIRREADLRLQEESRRLTEEAQRTRQRNRRVAAVIATAAVALAIYTPLQLRETEAKKGKLTKEIEQKRGELTGKQAEVIQVQAAIAHLTEQTKESIRELDEAKTLLAAAQAQKQGAEAQAAAAAAAQAKAQTESEAIKQHLSRLRSEQEKNELTIQAQETQIEAQKKQIEAQGKLLQQLLDRLEEANAHSGVPGRLRKPIEKSP